MDETSEVDRGPFADMDPAMIRAVTQYGTPPVRQMVRVVIRSERSDDFESLPDTIAGWHDWLDEAESEVPAEHVDDLRCELEFDHGYYDSPASASLTVWYERPEADEEMRIRVQRGINYVTSQAAQKRVLYEQLKAEFEK